MKKDAPKEFLGEYEKRKDNLESALQGMKDLLVLRLGQIRSMQGTRARLTDARLKRPAKIWKKAVKKGYAIGEAFEKIVDIIGIRIVCNNLSDSEAVVEMLRQQQGYLEINDIKETVINPAPDGYRAIHVRAMLKPRYIGSEETTPCEIQIRTLAQDTWARLSRADLYGKNTPNGRCTAPWSPQR
ncbi:MAG: hypothetical protein JRI36_06020 [Deltaproteobacteria bacterium]|nr:hypothetical protein [Deltaproteobacteria bacterium]